MSISTPFIRRPVATTLLTVAIALAVSVAFIKLPASRLPQVVLPTYPSPRKVNPAGAPIMILARNSDIYDRGKLYDAASTIMAQGLSQIPGVGQVNVGGGALPAVRVELNPTQLNSYGLGLANVASMLRQQNANEPKGQLSDGDTRADILANDQLLTAEFYRPLIVGYRNGAAIKLSDVADVEDSVENTRSAAYINGKPG